MEISSLIHSIGAFTEEAIVIADADLTDGAVLTIQWVNPAFSRLTGYRPDDIIGRTAGILAGENTDPDTLADIIARLVKWSSFVSEVVCHRADGTSFWGQISFQPIADDDGTFRYWICLIRDITEARARQERLSDLAMIAEHTDDMVAVLDRNRRVIWTNQSFTAFTGYTLDDARGRQLRDLFECEGTSQSEIAQLVADLDAQRPGFAEVISRRKDNSRFQGAYEIQPVFSPEGKLIRFVALLRDITKRRTMEKRYQAVFDETDSAISIKSGDHIVMVNARFAQAHGHPVDWFEGRRIGDFADAEAVADQRAMEQDVLATGKSVSWERIQTDKDGNKQFFLTRTSRLYDPVLDRHLICSVETDVSEIRRAQEQLRQSQAEAQRAEARLVAVMAALGDKLVIYDTDDRLVMFPGQKDTFNPGGGAFRPSRGMKYEDILRENLDRGIFTDAIGREEEWLAERLAAHRDPQGPLEQRLSSGKIYTIIEQTTEFGDTVTFRLDITEVRKQQARLEAYAADLNASHRLLEDRNRSLEEATKKLEHASLHDALTGLPNRRYLDEELQQRAALCATRDRRLAVLHIDLDRFKQINDTLGHAAGDKVLEHVARILRDETRGGDFPARVGGDEFVVLCDIDRDQNTLGAFADRILRRLSKPIRYDGHECRTGASIGVAVANTADTNPEKVLINADLALYRAKAQGRNRFAFFSEAVEAEIVATKRLGDDLMRAIERCEFEALYQPQFRLSDRSLAGAEALLRWQHPTKGTVYPSDFVGVAEDLNIQKQIDRVVLDQVIADDALWRNAGLIVPRLSVNVSGRRLRDPDLVEDIIASGIDPGRLTIEVLESIFLDDDDDVLAWNLDQLREMGVGIELDDFGTGHSSIVGLIRLKPNRLKIDKQFIDQSLKMEETTALVRSIVDIGHSLNVEVLAEGVETAAQDRLLRDLNCDVAQGYYYARPMTATEFQLFLKAPAPQLADG